MGEPVKGKQIENVIYVQIQQLRVQLLQEDFVFLLLNIFFAIYKCTVFTRNPNKLFRTDSTKW